VDAFLLVGEVFVNKLDGWSSEWPGLRREPLPRGRIDGGAADPDVEATELRGGDRRTPRVRAPTTHPSAVARVNVVVATARDIAVLHFAVLRRTCAAADTT